MTAGTFHSPAERVAWFSDLVMRTVPRTDGTLNVLDVGCGTGDQVFALARVLPRATFTGIDIVAENIAEARREISSSGDVGRIGFEHADFLAFEGQAPFDLVISCSVLQFLPNPDRVARQVVESVADDGIFVNVMPFRCAYNSGLAASRSVLRRSRTSWTDAALLQLARRLHANVMSPSMLRERIDYAYVVPTQYEDDLARSLGTLGFSTVSSGRAPHASPAQMKHRWRVMHRDSNRPSR